MKGSGRGLGAGIAQIVTSGCECIKSVYVLDSNGLCVDRWWSPVFFSGGYAVAPAVPQSAGPKHIVWHRLSASSLRVLSS
jgi:hypothetical protein